MINCGPYCESRSIRLLVITGIMLLCIVRAVFSQTQPQEQRTRRLIRVVPMKEVEVVSPDGNVTFTLLPNAERLTFTVKLKETTVIEPSPIVMNVDGYDLSSGVVFGNLERYEVNETYPWYGAHSTATNQCKGARITLQHDLSLTEYVLEVRAFNDGVAFRHVVPGKADTVRTPDEYTTFVVPSGSTVWSHDLDGHYEAEYVRQDISEVPLGQWGGPPVTLKLPGESGYASITEANLVNYSGMALESDGRRGWIVGLGHRQPLNYPFELRYGREEGKRLGRPASITGEIRTPWRVVMVGRDLNTLVNSTIIPNLCPPPDPKLFPQGIESSWIKPGRAVWRYVDGGETGFEGLKGFSRMAGLLGFEHHIIEGVWSRWTMEERKEMVEYSKAQGVGVWFWIHSRQLRTPEAREEFFTMLHDLGVVGTKIDFLDHEAREVVDHYEELLQKAAEHKILVVFHGSNKPTGRDRTWPNELVRESIRGMESSRLMRRARHQTILPFTRYLAGPADYTTMIFSERRRDSSIPQQIASMAVYSSPLLTIAAHPQSILDNPAADVIKSIPSVWDETIVLPDSKIGEHVAFARRKGTSWFLAVMSGTGPRTVRVPLSFLGSGDYRATLVRDDLADSAAVRIENTTLKSGNTLSLEMREGGGFVGRFTKK
ncbi:MAG: glycoside hydrolase family 97 N-terminal domain-containing protein [Ignavibacteriales bacterium]|nr:glycoside hydrolase family 97 N-terminal domain-containing protein [Ignavibacteriales bacterium]